MQASGKIGAALLALAAIAAGTVAYEEHLALVELRATAPDPAERERLRQAAWDAQRHVKELEAKLAAGAGAPGAPADAGEQQNRALGAYASDLIARIDDPEVRRLMDVVQRGQIVGRFAALFKALKLSPEKLAEFEDLLAERQNAGTDVLIAASQQGINPMQNPDQFRQMVQDAQGAIDAKIQATLGPDDYSQFQTFQQTQTQRAVVNQLQQNLSFTDTPLTEAQKTQMNQLVAQSPSAGQNGGAIDDNLVSQAQGFLSAPQVQVLQSLQQTQQANQQLQRLMAQGRAGDGGGPPAR
jgi:hypothetical protein